MDMLMAVMAVSHKHTCVTKMWESAEFFSGLIKIKGRFTCKENDLLPLGPGTGVYVGRR